MKYRKKPVVIEAVRLVEGCGDDMYKLIGSCKWGHDSSKRLFIDIETLEGKMRANEGDYIIKGIKGEFYPCKPDIFESTYEKVEEV